MEASYTVLYDACVLHPAPLRDTLMRMATTGLFRAKWSPAIHEEWIRSVLARRPDLRLEQLQRTRDLMDKSVLDCVVTGYEALIPSLSLPDPDDRHVLAAAIHSRADAIITFNLSDFPADILDRHHLEAIHPDDFLLSQMELSPPRAVRALKDQLAALKNPRKTADEFLDQLEQQGLSQLVARLRADHYADLLE
jgi:predicted nucleic acid-binding protein